MGLPARDVAHRIDVLLRCLLRRRIMDTVGHVDRIAATGGNTMARLVRGLQTQRIMPTHLLLVNFTYHTELKRKHTSSIPKCFFKHIQTKFEYRFSESEDPISIKWKSFNKGSSSVYWTVSRLEEAYVRQLTKGLMKKLIRSVEVELDLNPKNFQLSYITTKNLNYNIDIETGDEEAVANAAQLAGDGFQLVEGDELLELEDDDSGSAAVAAAAGTNEDREASSDADEENDGEETHRRRSKRQRQTMVYLRTADPDGKSESEESTPDDADYEDGEQPPARLGASARRNPASAESKAAAAAAPQKKRKKSARSPKKTDAKKAKTEEPAAAGAASSSLPLRDAAQQK